MATKLFTLRRIVGVKGEGLIDCVVLTFVAPPLGELSELAIWECECRTYHESDDLNDSARLL